ncbi:MAG: sugar transferase [Solirubrobacteraceae bacterium]|nr:sugar transferase [Solirubrobacteraceae bacterium]
MGTRPTSDHEDSASTASAAGLADVIPLTGREPVAPASGHLMPVPLAPAGDWSPGSTALGWYDLASPVAAGLTAALLSARHDTPFEGGLLVALLYLASGFVLRRRPPHASLLPFTSVLLALFPAVLGTGLLIGIRTLASMPDVGGQGLALIALAALVPRLLLARAPRRARPARAALIGAPTAAEMLARELAVAGIRDYRLVGAISADPSDAQAPDSMPLLGDLSNLGAIVESAGIDLLLMTGDAPRLAVFNELANSCLHLPVRLWELSAFYEEVFGHVPVAEINASWFQYIMHPKYRTTGGLVKRWLDLAVAVPLTILLGPLILALAAVVKRDGGPAFFRQTRIGEGGRPFTVLKLRTMRVSVGEEAKWADANDPRITPFGGLLRRTHLDELPQLVNVLRGDMTLVGPRPEQPQFVERLERAIPFYTRRHLIKPGVTGWAQVRCGYAGSDTGSAWKLCHDLYYLKHRSVALDLAILAETFRTLVADPQYDVEPAGVSFILHPATLAESDATPLASL